MTGERKQLVRALVDALYAWNTTTAGTKAAREAGIRAVEADTALTAFVERLTEARLAEVIEERELWRRAQIREEDALRDALAKLAEAERERDAIREAAKLDVQFAHELAEDKVEAIRADLAGAASERDKLADECNKLAGMVDTLRAERDTLVPLARKGWGELMGTGWEDSNEGRAALAVLTRLEGA